MGPKYRKYLEPNTSTRIPRATILRRQNKVLIVENESSESEFELLQQGPESHQSSVDENGVNISVSPNVMGYLDQHNCQADGCNDLESCQTLQAKSKTNDNLESSLSGISAEEALSSPQVTLLACAPINSSDGSAQSSLHNDVNNFDLDSNSNSTNPANNKRNRSTESENVAPEECPVMASPLYSTEDEITDGFTESENEALEEGPVMESPLNSTEDEVTDGFTESENDLSCSLNDDHLNGLIPGSDLSISQATVAIFMYALRHRLSDVALADLLKLINLILGKTIIPNSIYLFHKEFYKCYSKFDIHFYCENCQKILITYNCKLTTKKCIRTCDHCLENSSVGDFTKTNFFITVPISKQLKSKLSNPDFVKLLDYRDQRIKKDLNAYEDILDGEMYKKCMNDNSVGGNLDYSFIFNTDGAPVFKSSSFSIWPIFAMLNEIPPKERQKNVMLCGIWFGKKHIDMNTFLLKFVEEANILNENGINWK